MSRISRAISNYYEKLDEYTGRRVQRERSIRPAFFNLLDETEPSGWLVVGEAAVKLKSGTIYPDAVIKDRNKLTRGYYEAKDGDEDLDAEMVKKRNKGCSFNNILFENSLRAVIHDVDLREAERLERVIDKVVTALNSGRTRFCSTCLYLGKLYQVMERISI